MTFMRKDASDALEAAAALKANMDFAAKSRWRVRAIMDGGAPALQALLGDTLDDEGKPIEDMPWANWMLTALNKLAQKIGELAKVRVDADSDDEGPRLRAEKKRKTVLGYDEMDRMELQLPQIGRWIPGYGYGVWTIGARANPEGIPYPRAELRDPYDCYPGEWGVDQQPSELAVNRIIPVKKAIAMYPEAEEDIGKLGANAFARIPGTGGAVLLGATSSGWDNQRGRGIQIVEYYDADGIHILMPAIHKRVDFIPNPLDSGPCFSVPKRFAFNQLIGQYDHTFGLMAAGAKINALSVIAMEDGVFTETNVYGEVVGGKKYRKGRNSVNVLTPGSKVDKPQTNLPYQMFETINRIERQFRNVASYPVQDDAQSPLNFATGAGLNELLTSVSLEVREYHKVLRWGLMDIDSKRLEWDEKVSPNRRKPIAGRMSTIPGVETYRPNRDFRGDWKTRRTHGLMAGWDDSTKIVGGLQMLEAEVLDALTFQENIEGFDDIPEMNERIRDKKNADALHEILIAAAQQGDVRAVEAFIETLPEGEMKEILKKYFTPQDPQMTPEEEEFIRRNGQPGGGMEELFRNGNPAVQTVLSRLTPGGAQGGVQTVGRL